MEARTSLLLLKRAVSFSCARVFSPGSGAGDGKPTRARPMSSSETAGDSLFFPYFSSFLFPGHNKNKTRHDSYLAHALVFYTPSTIDHYPR
jgi:hypothetical protein